MKRNVSAFGNKEYDLLVVGGGIFGICTAWDAALRGLSVALIERGDYAGASSANCFKIVHGGIRYIQHADFARIRESSHERRALLRIAPHLVDPLPIVVPTYGHGMKGKSAMRAATAIYDAVTMDRNRRVPDPEKRIPNSGYISRDKCIDLFPGLGTGGLTGGAIIYDGHMYSPARLAFSFLMSAVGEGADVANYVEATGFLRNGDGVIGIRARDLLTQEELQIRSKVVVNAAGAWTERLLRYDQGISVDPPSVFSRDVAIVVNRRLLESRHGLAVQSKIKDPDAKFSRGARHLFMIPWRQYTQIGVWHVVHEGHPDEFRVTEDEVQEFLDQVNEAYAFEDPLTIRDVSTVNAGLTLFGENDEVKGDLSFGKRSRIIDHAREHGVDRLISVVGVRYTVARGVGEKAVDLVFKKLGRAAPKTTTATVPIYGGDIDDFGSFIRENTMKHMSEVSPEVMQGILRHYGSEYGEVIRHLKQDPTLAEEIGNTGTIGAQVVQAVKNEMAVKLGDVIFRRTDMGSGQYPGEEALAISARLMADELGWDEEKVKQEVEEVTSSYPDFLRQEAMATSR